MTEFRTVIRYTSVTDKCNVITVIHYFVIARSAGWEYGCSSGSNTFQTETKQQQNRIIFVKLSVNIKEDDIEWQTGEDEQITFPSFQQADIHLSSYLYSPTWSDDCFQCNLTLITWQTDRLSRDSWLQTVSLDLWELVRFYLWYEERTSCSALFNHQSGLCDYTRKVAKWITWVILGEIGHTKGLLK